MTAKELGRYKMIIETEASGEKITAEATLPYDVSAYIDLCTSRLILSLEDMIKDEGLKPSDNYYAYMVNEKLQCAWVLQFPEELQDDKEN